ncbi:MAG: SpoIID/LytB domain-containing protein [Clostridiales bacterium]|nr:SpoIID/LytB domain-containing protein [Clostridiales bacterium]
MIKRAAAAMGSALLIGLCALQAQAAHRTDDALIRVGLSYGSGPVAAVNALADAGYELGYYDGENFVAVGQIANRYVSFCKDALLSVDGRTVSEGGAGQPIKPYHLEVDCAFATQQEAEDFIAQLRAGGYVGEAFPASIDGVHRVRIEMYSQSGYAADDAARIEQYTQGHAVRVVGEDAATITVIDLNNLAIAYELRPPDGLWPAARAADGGAVKNGLYYYNGAFELRRLSGGDITFINVVTLFDYLKGVLPYEMDGAWPLEALKAQAVCARSYVLFNLGKHRDYDICNAVHCQVYYGTEKENEAVRSAVEETRNQVLCYDGKLISTFYFSSSGGYTESSENAWGGAGYPYYAAVPDPYEDPAAITTFSKTLTAGELTALLNGMGVDIGPVTDCYVSKYTEPAGNVYEVTFVGSAGRTHSIARTDNVRIKLNSLVRSPRFQITSGQLRLVANSGEALGGDLRAIDGEGRVSRLPALPKILTAAGLTEPEPVESDGTFTFAGAGFGHNVGMSQYGAKGMAEAGKTCREILLHYFTGVEIHRTDEMG